MTQNKKLYTIGDISNICGVPVKTLRYYDEISLFVPQKRDSETNYRYYTEEQMLTLYNIRKLKNYGFSLDEIHSLITENDIKKLKESLNSKLSDVHEKIAALEYIYNDIKNSIEKLELKSERNDSILIEQIPEHGVIYTKRNEKNFKNDVIPVYRWFEIFELLRKNKLKAQSSIKATYHNPPLEQFLKTYCSLEISIDVNDCANFPFYKKIPSFKAITSLHYGSLSTIINTYVKTIKWLNTNHFEINGPISEEFIVSQADIKSENDYVTKLIIPVK